MLKWTLTLWILLLLLSTKSFGQESLKKGGGWLGTFAKKALDEDYSFWAENQARYDFKAGGLGQILYRTGVLYNINPNHGLGLLYGYIQSGDLKEHRWTLQHTEKYGLWGPLLWSHRVRLEGRILENSDDDAARLRFLLRAQTHHNSCYKYVTWNEVFINMTQEPWTGSRSWDRNRFFIGVRQSLFHSNIEWGYLNQWVWRNPRDTVEHLLVLYLFL